MNVIIQLISYEKVAPYQQLARREGVFLEDLEGAVWFGAMVNGRLAGFVCCYIKAGYALFKCDYVFHEYRGLGVYDQLFRARLDYARKQNIREIGAYCNQMSVNRYVKYGFEKNAEPRRGITYMLMKVEKKGRE